MAFAKKCNNQQKLIQYHPNTNKLATVIVTVKGQYQTIIIDPPWPISKIERYTAPLQTTETTFDEYPTMTVEAIQKSQFPFGISSKTRKCQKRHSDAFRPISSNPKPGARTDLTLSRNGQGITWSSYHHAIKSVPVKELTCYQKA